MARILRRSPNMVARAGWTLSDAKTRLAEVIRRARVEGPQRINMRGQDAVIVTAVTDASPLSAGGEAAPFVSFMESLEVDGLDLTRDGNTGRDMKM